MEPIGEEAESEPHSPGSHKRPVFSQTGTVCFAADSSLRTAKLTSAPHIHFLYPYLRYQLTGNETHAVGSRGEAVEDTQATYCPPIPYF